LNIFAPYGRLGKLSLREMGPPDEGRGRCQEPVLHRRRHDLSGGPKCRDGALQCRRAIARKVPAPHRRLRRRPIGPVFP